MGKPLPKLKFGSDGFRGVIADCFTWENLQRLTLATVSALRGLSVGEGAVVPVGYDTRFLADKCAVGVCRLLTASGYKPILSETFCPSPYLSFAVKAFSAPIGIMITASHNPPYYLGFKVKGMEGGSALPHLQEMIAGFTQCRGEVQIDTGELFVGPYVPKTFDLTDDYVEGLFNLVDVGLLREKLSAQVTVDFMHGATSGVYARALAKCGGNFQPIRTSVDPLFGGNKPEPVGEGLKTLIAWVEAGETGGVGAAFDGDGDRLALVDECGEIVPPHEIFAIVLLHLMEGKGRSGRVVKTVSYSCMIDRVARHFQAPVIEIPVGFKHATEELLKPDTLAAGEESGGIGFGFYLPERDALLLLLLVLEAMCEREMSMRNLREEIWERFGRSYFYHEDVPLRSAEEDEGVRRAIEAVKENPAKIRIDYERVSSLDGIKLIWDTGFLLMRMSGTEPLLRIYVDDTDVGRVSQVAKRARRFLGLR